ncbi:hypothetical protein [Hymenobacter rubripertinctus]|uniref:Uncharacterized protein n=1 Tax=Hymenobacter rubripertinctus TaxID=2029981 RepID=A0A418RA33_9BACT|nr:hypothetical protein [Hymenobacter rubripertinctus]RIY14152.1 hypothetical protein D0T11_00230 [Hymenobacter rubripertinctus]
MNDKNIGLETFMDHHRADFDVFEPRPDLWDDIALDLDLKETAAQPQAPPLRVLPLFPTAGLPPVAAPDAAVRSARPYGVAAAVATLLLLSTWFWQHRTEATIWTRTGQPVVAAAAGSPDSYAGPELAATAAATGPEQRLASAVQRMEAYYTTQLTEREQALRQADTETAVAPRADWQQELTALDSTYQQLKTELYRNPEPDVVLAAMNRNMQIRLDLLAQQLRTRERIREYHSQPYMVADSRRIP